MNRKHLVRGFTLVELMVAGAILAVVLSASMGAFITTNTATQQIYLTGNMQDTARQSLDALASDIRAAGLGASNGTVGIAPGGVWAARIPTIYSSPAQTYTDPSGHTFTLNSIYIIGGDPSTVGINAAGDGVEGVVTSPTGVSISCNNGANVPVLCETSAIGTDGVEHGLLISPAANVYQPLMLHDHQNASMISPTAISGSAGAEVISFAEAGGSVLPSPNPTAPFGFAQGFQVARVRVVHWYLKQSATTSQPRLYRSRPTLTTGGGSCATPFVDETTDPINGVKGVEMGAGPVESLQLRYVFDPNGLGDPTQYNMTDTIDPCQGPVLYGETLTSLALTPSVTRLYTRMRQLREVRVQLVSISPSPARTTAGDVTLTPQQVINNAAQVRYITPTFEGATAGTTADQYPRRAYVTRVAPRNFLQ